MAIKRFKDQEWLALLMQSSLSLAVCRYNVRRGSWEHEHANLEEHFFCFVEQGLLKMRVNGERLDIASGEMLWVQPGATRTVCGSLKDLQVRHVNVRLEIQFNKQHCARKHAYYQLQAAQELRKHFTELLEYVEAPGPFPVEQLKIIIAHLCNDTLALERRSQQASGAQLHAGQRHQLQRYIADHITESISPHDLAAHMSLSLDYFTRCFRRSYGVAPRRYLVEERMRLAAVQLIDCSSSVVEIARAVGIEDSNYFCRQFKKIIGATPTAFRKRGVLPRRLE